jgi:hypothetical protein
MLKRSTSHKEKGTPTQTRVDTGSWTVMSKIFKTAIGKAWAKKNTLRASFVWRSIILTLSWHAGRHKDGVNSY